MSKIIPIQVGPKVPSILISGDYGGGGKTKVAEIIGSILGYLVIDSGKFAREEAENMGYDNLGAFFQRAKLDGYIDEKIDNRQLDFLKNQTNFIMVSRLGAFFQPNAFKVFLRVDPFIGAARVFPTLQSDPSRKGESVESPEILAQKNITRFNEDRDRYKKTYGVDYASISLYDFMLNTEEYSEIQVANIIISTYQKWLTRVTAGLASNNSTIES